MSDSGDKGPGNEVSAEDFVRHLSSCQHRLYDFIHSLLPSSTDADEVMQETSLVLWRKRSQFDPERDFAKWACGVARLEVFKYRNGRKSHAVFLSDALLEEIAATHLRQVESEEAAEVSRLEALRCCLEKLRPSDRQLVQQRYAGKTTARQVAKDLGRPESTVYQALARIRSQLLDCVQRTLSREVRKV